jgi:putative RecB family exonuclease
VVVYSHSRISTYENCPFQYKLRYVDKAVPLLGSSIESYMGKVVHEALEWLYDTAINHDLATKKEVIDYYEKRWVSRWKKDIRSSSTYARI